MSLSDETQTTTDPQELAQSARELFDLCDDLDPALRCSLAGLLAIGASDDRVLELLEAAVGIANELDGAHIALGEYAQQLGAECHAGFEELERMDESTSGEMSSDTDDVLRASLVIAQDREEQTDVMIDQYDARVTAPELRARITTLTERALRLQGVLITELQ